MKKRSLNKRRVAALALMALASVGLYKGVDKLADNIAGEDTPAMAEERKQSAQMREAIGVYLPLAIEMVMTAPNAAYPEPPLWQGHPQTMRQAFESAKDITEHRSVIGMIHFRCATLSYLSDVHRIATESFVERKLENPNIDIEKHIKVAKQQTTTAPICRIKGYD